jgi:glycosyltransferase involved in cell wall biosynthesis
MSLEQTKDAVAGERPKLSVIAPLYNEEENVYPLYEAVTAALEPTGLHYEMLLVDDGSKDTTLSKAIEIAQRDPRIKVVKFRRNCGQTAAMAAGIEFSSGEVLVTMDGDLQNDPADIPMLLDKLNEGYDAVLGLRTRRQDHLFIRKIPSLVGNWLIRKVTGVQIKDMGCTLRALRRELAEALPLYGELHRFVPVLAQQYGGRLVQVPVRHHARVAGKTKYNLTRTVRVMLDLITLKFLHSYLTRPMHIMGLAGLVSMGLGVLSLLGTIWMKSHSGLYMTGNPLLLLSAMLELIGVQFISMGLLGELMMRTYFESQGKTSYAVRSTVNLEQPARRRAA